MKRAVKNVVKGRQGLKGPNNTVFTHTSTDHYLRCSTATERHEDKGKKQATIVDMFHEATKQKGQGTKNDKRQKWSLTLTVLTANWTESNYINIHVQVKVKKSSPKVCRPAVYQQLTDSLPTANRHLKI